MLWVLMTSLLIKNFAENVYGNNPDLVVKVEFVDVAPVELELYVAAVGVDVD